MAVVAILTLLLLAVTLLPLWRNPHWLVRGQEFPRLQYATIAALLLAAQGLLLDPGRPSTWALLAVTAACLAWQAWWILPYTPLWPVEVRSAGGAARRGLSILTANVLTSNRDAEPLLRLVREHRPDLVVTLESDRWWQDRLDALEPDWPHTVKCPQDNLYGMHVYSRLPLREAEIEFLVEEDVPSIHLLVELPQGEAARMHFLHPAPPSPSENPESAERDAELVIVARAVADCAWPVVVAGDLNDVAWSPTTRLFRKLSGLLDPRVGRGMYNTFHAKVPFARWPLDHLFHSRHFTLRSMRRLPPIGSDHFALFTELAFTPLDGADQEGLEEGAGDRSRAREIADEQKVDERRVPRPGGDAGPDGAPG